MIKIRLVLANSREVVVKRPTTRETVEYVEFMMRCGMAGIRGINIRAHPADIPEGVRVKEYLANVDLDLRIRVEQDRQVPDLIDVYGLAGYPRKKEAQ